MRPDAERTGRKLGPARDPNADFDPLALGERLRLLRTGRGLTLGQVAEGRFSAAFLSQIERGLARPSAGNLAHIAGRLGVDLGDLLSSTPRAVDREMTELRLSEARTAIARDEAQVAFESLEQLPEALSDRDAFEADLLVADTLVRLGRYTDGLRRLQAGQARPRATLADSRLRIAEITGRAHYRRQRYHQALDALRGAEDAVDDPAVDPMTRSRFLTARGMCQFMLGNEHAAIIDYEAALEASGKITDLAELGRIYDGLNQAHRLQGNLDEALDYARRSTQIFETLQNSRHVGTTLTNMGEVLVRKGDLDGAVDAFERAVAAFRTAQVGAYIAYPLVELASVALLRDEPGEARRLADEAIAACERSGDRELWATCQQLLARVALAGDDLAAAEHHLGAAITAFDEVGVATALAEASYLMGTVLQRKGDDSRALIYALRAYSATHPEPPHPPAQPPEKE